MIAKSTIKLIDEAVIPAMVLITAKIIGLFMVNYLLKIDFAINPKGFLAILPTLTYTTPTDYIVAENYSNLAMFVAVSLGTLMVVFKAHFLHETHISPKFHQKLIKLNLEKFVSTSFHLYHQVTIWLIFLWLVTVLIVLSTLSEIMYPQISAIAVIIALNFSWILAVDIQKEIEIARDKI